MYFDLPPANHREALFSAERQPQICLDDEHFLISKEAFEGLPDYTGSKPTGVYHGKCWKMKRSDGKWWIGCYIEEDPPHPDGLLTPIRKALIVD